MSQPIDYDLFVELIKFNRAVLIKDKMLEELAFLDGTLMYWGLKFEHKDPEFSREQFLKDTGVEE